MTLAEKILAAETAYHDLVTGNAVRVWQDQNGERVEYTAASAPRLLAYIKSLRGEQASTGYVGPIRFNF